MIKTIFKWIFILALILNILWLNLKVFELQSAVIAVANLTLEIYKSQVQCVDHIQNLEELLKIDTPEKG